MENPPQPNPQDNVENPPQPKPQQPNPNLEGEQDRNSQIIARLTSLRRLSSSIRGGDHLRESLADAFDKIRNTIVKSQGAHTENPGGNTTLMD